jgi:drug/metabolite transporter (DMT)-like permease
MMITGTPLVPKLWQGLFILLAVTAVGIADILLKKATYHGNLGAALSSPWLFTAIGLYLLQIVIFTFAFVSGWKLSLIGALQTALYAIIVLAAGLLLYNESLTRAQVIGILMAFGGVVLINWS